MRGNSRRKVNVRVRKTTGSVGSDDLAAMTTGCHDRLLP